MAGKLHEQFSADALCPRQVDRNNNVSLSLL